MALNGTLGKICSGFPLYVWEMIDGSKYRPLFLYEYGKNDLSIAVYLPDSYGDWFNKGEGWSRLTPEELTIHLTMNFPNALVARYIENYLSPLNDRIFPGMIKSKVPFSAVRGGTLEPIFGFPNNDIDAIPPCT